MVAPATCPRCVPKVAGGAPAQSHTKTSKKPEDRIYRLSREGKIPTIRIGKYCRYRLDEIEKFERGEVAKSEGGA